MSNDNINIFGMSDTRYLLYLRTYNQSIQVIYWIIVITNVYSDFRFFLHYIENTLYCICQTSPKEADAWGFSSIFPVKHISPFKLTNIGLYILYYTAIEHG